MNHHVSWDEIESEFDESSALLLGNGFSISCWKQFSYYSLFETARKKEFLSPEAINLFGLCGVSGFEIVLESLRQAILVAQALGSETERIVAVETNIRQALFHSVRDVHVPHTHISPSFDTVEAELAKFGSIFTTNYDLIPYWAFMAGTKNKSAACMDFFHNSDAKGNANFEHTTGFYLDRVEEDLKQVGTKLFYLHGALHLFEQDGCIGKVKYSKAKDGNSVSKILDWIEREHYTPLIVTEGRALKKRQFISDNSYLNWAFEQFESHDGPLLIFGHGLSEEADGHLLDVIKKWRNKQLIAVSVFPLDPNLESFTDRLTLTLGKTGHQVVFFDSTQHPLCRAVVGSATT